MGLEKEGPVAIGFGGSGASDSLVSGGNFLDVKSAGSVPSLDFVGSDDDWDGTS